MKERERERIGSAINCSEILSLHLISHHHYTWSSSWRFLILDIKSQLLQMEMQVRDPNFAANSQKPPINPASIHSATVYPQQPSFFKLPASSPYDNFLKAAGCWSTRKVWRPRIFFEFKYPVDTRLKNSTAAAWGFAGAGTAWQFCDGQQSFCVVSSEVQQSRDWFLHPLLSSIVFLRRPLLFFLVSLSFYHVCSIDWFTYGVTLCSL